MDDDIQALAERLPVSSDSESDSEVVLRDGRRGGSIIHHDSGLGTLDRAHREEASLMDDVLQESGLVNILCRAPQRALRESELEGVVGDALDELFQQRGLFRGRGQVPAYQSYDSGRKQSRQAFRIANLPTHRITASEVAAATPENCACAICMEEFQGGDMQRTLPCFHRFHLKCVDRWLKRTPSCPTCKHEIPEVRAPLRSALRETAGGRRRSRSLRRRSPSPIVLSCG